MTITTNRAQSSALSTAPTQPLARKHDFDAVFDSQGVFRSVLEAFSYPGRTINIKDYSDRLLGLCTNNTSKAPNEQGGTQGEQSDESLNKVDSLCPACLAVAMTLLDNEVSFSVCNDRNVGSGASAGASVGACEPRAFADTVTSLTLAEEVATSKADFIFIGNEVALAAAIEQAKSGTLADPHKSATLVIANKGEFNQSLSLEGPGIRGQASISATSTMLDALRLRDEQSYEYPEGIDFLFVTADSNIIALPRLVRKVGENDANAPASAQHSDTEVK